MNWANNRPIVEVTYLTRTEDNLLRQVSYRAQPVDKPVRMLVRPVSPTPPQVRHAGALQCWHCGLWVPDHTNEFMCYFLWVLCRQTVGGSNQWASFQSSGLGAASWRCRTRSLMNMVRYFWVRPDRSPHVRPKAMKRFHQFLLARVAQRQTEDWLSIPRCCEVLWDRKHRRHRGHRKRSPFLSLSFGGSPLLFRFSYALPAIKKVSEEVRKGFLASEVNLSIRRVGLGKNVFAQCQ